MPLEEEYAQTASVVLSIHALLEGYPLSAGIFRELVANSDDAGALKQVRLFAPQFCSSHPVKTFVLDKRNHLTESLYTEGLARSQGPASMAFNDRY